MTKTEKANWILLWIYKDTKGDEFEHIDCVRRNSVLNSTWGSTKQKIDYDEFSELLIKLRDKYLILMKTEWSRKCKCCHFDKISLTKKGVETCEKLIEKESLLTQKKIKVKANNMTDSQKESHLLQWIYNVTEGNVYHKTGITTISQSQIENLDLGIEAKERILILISLKENSLISMTSDYNLNSIHEGVFKEIRLTKKGKQKCESLKENVDLITKDIKQIKMKEPKIFISHSSKDKDVVEKVIDVLEAIGVPSEKIFCSSFDGYGVKLGEDFLDYIKKELDSYVMVLFLLSNNFYESPICLCEMGATWVKTNKHIPILIPPFDYKDVEGVIPTTQGMKINEKFKLNSLKDSVIEFIGLPTLDSTFWERKRDKTLGEINKILNSKTPINDDNKKNKNNVGFRIQSIIR